jgi:hypothetical protein
MAIRQAIFVTDDQFISLCSEPHLKQHMLLIHVLKLSSHLNLVFVTM